MILFLVSCFLFLAPAAFAVDIPSKFGSSFTNIGALISRLVPNLIMGAGVIFFLLILYSGFNLVRSAGANRSPQEVAQARAVITYATVGFLLVVSAYFILQIVKIITGVDFFNPPVT